MNIKESDCHCNNHRNRHDPDYKTGDKEEGTAEFTENSDHKGHIAAKTENTWIDIHQFCEIHHLIQTVRKKKHTEYNS